MLPRCFATAGLAVLIASRTLSAQAAATDASKTANKFYLDYNVPESPAFTVLGVTPSSVLRGTASKPLIVSLLTQTAKGERIASGVALDVAPYAYLGRFKNVKEYNDSPVKRFFANLLTSLATTQAPGDTASVAFAAGVRATFHDDHDLLADTALVREIGAKLVPIKISGKPIQGSNIPAMSVTQSDTTIEIDLAAEYAAARKRMTETRGWAASIGGAIGGTLRSGIPRSDSLQQRVGNAWLGVTGYLGAGQELLGSAQWARDTTGLDHFRAGVAYRLQSASSAIAAELAYDNHSGGVLPGLNAELRLMPRFTLIAAIVTDPPTADTKKVVRFKTSVRWSATEGF
jgi:hypothetical protein